MAKIYGKHWISERIWTGYSRRMSGTTRHNWSKSILPKHPCSKPHMPFQQAILVSIIYLSIFKRGSSFAFQHCFSCASGSRVQAWKRTFVVDTTSAYHGSTFFHLTNKVMQKTSIRASSCGLLHLSCAVQRKVFVGNGRSLTETDLLPIGSMPQ